MIRQNKKQLENTFFFIILKDGNGMDIQSLDTFWPSQLKGNAFDFEMEYCFEWHTNATL